MTNRRRRKAKARRRIRVLLAQGKYGKVLAIKHHIEAREG